MLPYKKILYAKGSVKVLLQTYFGDARDCYSEICGLDFDGIGLDFIEGKKSLELVTANGFPKDKILFAGVVNGKNIWRNHYGNTVNIISKLKEYCGEIVLNTSCSLLHVPYTLKNESKLPESVKKHFAYAEEKLSELAELKKILSSENPLETAEYIANSVLCSEQRSGLNEAVREKAAAFSEKDFVRLPEFAEREKVQKKTL